MAEDFARSVDRGLNLSKRIYYGKEPPKLLSMERKMPAAESNLPTAPMMYAVITEPVIVDNPDIPSYQPYVHGRCEPPALIPLQMHAVAMEVDCYLETVFITVSGTWRVHCVSASKTCDCRVAIPMGEQGSVLGVSIETPSRSYCTELITTDETDDPVKLANAKDGFLLKRQIYTLKVPQVVGGSVLSAKVRWSQKMLYQDGQVCLTIPFSFPLNVNPVVKKLSKKEKIILNVNSGTGTVVCCQSASHPLQVSSVENSCGLLLKSPSRHDFDQRNMFCFYLYPPHDILGKLFRKEMVFVVDTSASMQGSPLEHVKTSLQSALSKLDPEDTFNIIAFNDTSLSFSPKMEPATKETIDNAIQWINLNIVANGSTNFSLPLDQAMKMISKSKHSIPLLFLITDGTVEDEREICEVIRCQLTKGGLNSPRICTICLKDFSQYRYLDYSSPSSQFFFIDADDSSKHERNIAIYGLVSIIYFWKLPLLVRLHFLIRLSLYPNSLPDLLSGNPLILYGRYHGNVPDNVEVKGTLADFSNFEIGVKVHKVMDMPLERVFSGRQMGMLTAQAWLTGKKELENKVIRLSLQTGLASEYTRTILVESEKGKQISKRETLKEVMMTDSTVRKILYLRQLGLGFGNLKATAENLPPKAAEPKLHETSDAIFAAAANCCSKMVDCCCCMCFIQLCSKLSDRCAVTLTQLCTALACFECINVCCEICECDLCQ
nr:von Willebrand factor A domain-containing protein DDB_G0285981-like isoform X2 [Ipomoea batatas]